MSNRPGTSPGSIADRTYRRAFKLAAIAGAIAVAILYLEGPLRAFGGSEFVVVILLYPIYLLSVAIILAIWLGYPPDERDLERVYEVQDDEKGEF